MKIATAIQMHANAAIVSGVSFSRSPSQNTAISICTVGERN